MEDAFLHFLEISKGSWKSWEEWKAGEMHTSAPN